MNGDKTSSLPAAPERVLRKAFYGYDRTQVLGRIAALDRILTAVRNGSLSKEEGTEQARLETHEPLRRCFGGYKETDADTYLRMLVHEIGKPEEETPRSFFDIQRMLPPVQTLRTVFYGIDRRQALERIDMLNALLLGLQSGSIAWGQALKEADSVKYMPLRKCLNGFREGDVRGYLFLLQNEIRKYRPQNAAEERSKV